MGDKTGIEWCDATWNPTTGCDKVSPGCSNCYAMTQAARLKLMGQPKYQRDGDPKTSGPGFGLTEHPDVLDQPLRWKRPRRIFVNSMSDLFHPDVSDGFLVSVFAYMGLAEWHTFQVLTKRPQRMAALLNREEFWRFVRRDAASIADNWSVGGHPVPAHLHPVGGENIRHLPNVWLGTSIESQQYAFRARHLLDTPAAVRFVSAEPLLGPVDLTEYLRSWRVSDHNEVRYNEDAVVVGWSGRLPTVAKPHLDWVIAGGESGRDARPMHPDWARSLRDQCQAAGVAFLFKQWGEWSPYQVISSEGNHPGGLWTHEPWSMVPGPDGSETWMWKAGKRRAGRGLDGRLWDGYPG